MLRPVREGESRMLIAQVTRHKPKKTLVHAQQLRCKLTVLTLCPIGLNVSLARWRVPFGPVESTSFTTVRFQNLPQSTVDKIYHSGFNGVGRGYRAHAPLLD